MKKILLLMALLCTFGYGYAQSTIETALPLEEGDNITYTDENANGIIVYYKYTAPESQDKLIKVTKADYSVSSDMLSEDSQYINGVYLSDGYAYPVKAGQTAYLKISTWSGTTATFGVSITNCDADGGATCNDAIALSTASTYIPSYYDMTTYTNYPTYASYTCTEDGILELSLSSSVSTLQVMESCDDTTPETISASYKNSLYVGLIPVTNGNTYILRMELYSSPIVMTATVTHPAPGATPHTALNLQEGNNTYTFEQPSTDNNVVYYSYTAPENQGKLLQFSSTNSSVRCYMTDENGNSISGLNSSDYSTTSYPIKPGQKVILEIGGYGITEVSFNITLLDANTDGGKNCEDAIAIGETATFVPQHYDGTSPIDTYLAYTCNESGLLEMHFTGSVSSCIAQVGCDATTSENISVEYIYESGMYIGKYPVEEGNTYIFRVQSYYPMYVSVALSHPTKGQSCDMPFDGGTTNTLPKEAGSYWYKYIADSDGYMIISSECSLAGGSISVWSNCSAYSANESVDGYFALRTSVYNGNSYLINIEKTESTAEEESFNISVEAEKTGDTSNDPILIEANQEITTPKYNGVYYYKVTVPEGNNCFLVVDAKQANIAGYATAVYIYDEDNTWSSLASGTDYARAQAEGGNSYIIEWKCYEGINSFPFTVRYEQIENGTTCDSAIEAVKGDNELPEGNEYYFSYTATQNGWLIIDTDVTIGVTFLRGCNSWDGTYQSTKIANINKCELLAGEKCIIKFTNIEYESSFFLSEEAYKEGESCETAISIIEGNTSLPENAGKYWYKYTADKDCKVTISSDIVYESFYDESTYTSYSSSIKVLTDCNEYGNEIMQTSSEGSVFKGSFVVNNGDILYIKVVTISAQTDKKLTIETTELAPGESCTNPIEITPGELILHTGATRNNPVWYSINLEPGTFSVTSQGSYDYFGMTLYDSCDATYELATTSYYDEKYALTYDIQTKGYYYLKLDAIYNEITVIVSGSYSGVESTHQDSNIRVIGNNIIVTADNTRTDVIICDITGKIVASQAVYDQATFSLDKGIYIVKAGNHISKVAIR